LGDTLGRRRIFLVGTMLFTLASAWCGLVSTPLQLIIARSVQGIGGALLVPSSLALISAAFSDGGRGRAIGLWAGFSALTSAGGPMLAGWLVDNLSWRWIFFIHVPLAIAVIAIVIRQVPESRDETMSGDIDWWGGLLATLALGGVTYGLIESNNTSLSDPVVIAALMGGLVLFGLFLWFEHRRGEPMVPLGLFRSGQFSSANGQTLLLYAALTGMFFFLPLNLIQVQGYSATAAGAAMLPTFLLLALLSRRVGGLVDTIGARKLLIAGPLVVGAGAALLAWPGIGGSYWLTFFPGLVVLGLGLSLAVAPVTTTVMSAVADRHAGTASGINNAIARMAQLLGIAILGVIMLARFSGDLQQNLAQVDIPAATRQTLYEHRTDLAEIRVPEALSDSQQTAVEQTIDEAFVAGFRLVSLVAAGLAIGSSLITWLTIQPEQV
jgi:EmrB/QacA subfamily drug resistance transporter